MVSHTGLKLRMAVAGSILFGFYLLLFTLVWAAYGDAVLPLAAVGIVLFIGVQYKLGKWLALRSVGAEDMPEDGQYRQIHQSVDYLCEDMNLEKPQLKVARMGVPNAFATGRRGAGVVVLSEEIIQLLSHEELEGVIAHELAHLDNRDTVVMILGQAIATIIGYLAYMAIAFSGRRGIGQIFLGMIAASLAQMFVMIFVLAISRYREYVADSDAADVTGNPDAMARALEKISGGSRGKEHNLDEGVSAMAINGVHKGLLTKIFATHPPIEERVERLRSGY